MPGSTIPKQKKIVERLLQEEGPRAKGKMCEGLPDDMVHLMIEDQVESGYTPENCGSLRLLCQNPSCEKKCWKAPPRTKNVIDSCKEVMKVNRCLNILENYKNIREQYKKYILGDINKVDIDDELDYFDRVMKKRIEDVPRFGPYKLMIGNYYDIEVEEEINELKEKLSQARGVEQIDTIKHQLFQAIKELNTYNLPNAARPYTFTREESSELEKYWRERYGLGEGMWSKYTIKTCLKLLFSRYPDLANDLCFLFIDDNKDEDGEDIFDQQELIAQGYPNNSESFLNGNIIMDIIEALDIFFEGDRDTWSRMLQVFDNRGFSESEKNTLIQKFLNMIGFLDGLYIGLELASLQYFGGIE
jgi:hypothetical protein